MVDTAVPAPKVFMADRGHDADRIRTDLEARGAVPIIPERKTRKNPILVDEYIYALRNRVERAFCKLKCSRRLATRYDKIAASYLGFVHICSIRLWIREFVNMSWPNSLATLALIPDYRALYGPFARLSESGF